MDGELLTADEIRTLQRDNPQGLFAHLHDVQRAFLFGVEDHRDEPEAWGGEVRLTINRNIVLHFVPRLNSEMSGLEELPQFCVFPDDARADSAEDTSQRIDDDEEIPGVVFYVDPDEYDRMVGEATRVSERFGDLDLIPDTYFLDTELIAFVNRTVLEHGTVRTEREYDFKRGMFGGSQPPPLDDEPDEALPRIEDRDDPSADEDDDDDLDGKHLRTLKL
jgi:hypothetical protein